MLVNSILKTGFQTYHFIRNVIGVKFHKITAVFCIEISD